jgi:phospholipid/cholesterol/gamma-HCH transport system substrate-binding protein
MENRLSYILVGLFVLVLLFAGVGSVLWLGNYSDKGNFKFYKVATKESVSGLNEKAPVKLNGVIIGEVRGIKINPKNAEEVLVVVRVEESAPIKQDTYALIQAQGITGLSFIQLQGGTNDSSALATNANPDEYGIIPSQPSTFSRLDKTISSLSGKAEDIFNKTDEILNEKNIKNLELILENSAKISVATAKTLENIEQHNKEISQILKEAVVFEKAAIEAARSVQAMSQTLSSAIDSTGIDTMNSIKNVMLNLDEKIKKGTFDIDILMKDSLSPLQNTLDELRILSIESKALIDHLNASPSDLFFKSETINPAPNEVRSR